MQRALLKARHAGWIKKETQSIFIGHKLEEEMNIQMNIEEAFAISFLLHRF